jgi:hypothetical protein
VLEIVYGNIRKKIKRVKSVLEARGGHGTKVKGQKRRFVRKTKKKGNEEEFAMYRKNKERQ